MKGILTKNRGAAIFAGFVLLIGIFAGSAITGNAQDNRYGRNWDGYPNWGGDYQLRQTALNAGYNEGSRQGTSDRARGRQSDFQNSSSYRNGNKDYNSRMGDRELYRRYFQLAFENGYADGFGTSAGSYQGNNYPGNNYPGNTYPGNTYPGNGDRGRHRSRYGRNWDGYPNWGGDYQLRQTALNAGYNEGNRVGRQDSSRNRYSDYSRSSVYRNATKDYSPRLGDRELYRRYFQEAFQNGYADGYQGF
jgi:hypothetical protein